RRGRPRRGERHQRTRRCGAMTPQPIPVTETLTPGEKSLWLLQRLVPEHGITNVAFRVQAAGPMRWWPLREALRWLVDRHPALRSSFPLRGDEPVREVLAPDEVDIDLDMVDVTAGGLPAALREYAAAPFQMESPPRVRLGLFQVTPD